MFTLYQMFRRSVEEILSAGFHTQCGPLCRNVRHPRDMSAKSNFTSDLIFQIPEGSEKIGFHFFVVQNLKWQSNQNES